MTVVIIIAVAVGAIGVVGVVLLAAVTLLGRSADSELTPVDSVATAPVERPAPPVFEPVETTPVADPYGPGLHPFCPEPAEVAAATGQSGMEVDEPRHATTTLDLNGVVVSEEVCEYGGTTSVGRITGPDAQEVLDRLLASDGRFTVWEGDLDVPSVRVVLPSPSGPEGGSVREVLVVDGEVLTVARNGQDHDGVDALVEVVRG